MVYPSHKFFLTLQLLQELYLDLALHLQKNELGAKFIATKDIRLIINSIMIGYNSFFINIFIVKIIQKIGLIIEIRLDI